MSAVGKTSVQFNPNDRGSYTGVALVPGTGSGLAARKIPTVTTSGHCVDPALAPDLILPDTGICAHGGAVMHSNETFDLSWDPVRRDWATTRNYVEQFLRDVADGSGTLTSPYAVTPQYTDATGRAGNASLYGGGCIDYGATGGSTCKFGDSTATGTGHDYLSSSACPVAGTNWFHEALSGAFNDSPNDICLTDAQIQGELAAMIAQGGLISRTQPGYTPLLVLMTPPGVEVCLDAAGKLCSANGTIAPPTPTVTTASLGGTIAPGIVPSFCSYHSQVDVRGTEVAYVVQPWTALTACDELGLDPFWQNPIATEAGIRLVNPLSQGQIAAIVNPGLNGWFALNGSEVNDNGCVPFGKQYDSVTVGSSAQNKYVLQREFNNGGVIETDPNAPSCAPSVALAPAFVVPSPANQGDVVQLDGSKTVSTLLVPRAGYVWNFGDGKTAVGPSVVHTYAKGGTYAVHLTTTDRGGNVRSLSQTIVVLGPDGKPVSPPVPPTPGLTARLQLMPQGLRAMLRSGLSIRVTSNKAANGIVTLSVPRKAARRAHIRAGRGTAVVIGRGTVSGIKAGTVTLRLRLSRTTAAELRRLGHVTVTIRLRLVAAAGEHVAVDAAARY